MHHSLSPWLHENRNSAQPGDSDWNCNAGTTLSETSKGRRWPEPTLRLSETWSATNRASLIKRLISNEIVLVRVSSPKANIWTFAMMCFSVMSTCRDFQSLGLHYCSYEQIYMCCISRHTIRTPVKRGEQLCRHFLANLSRNLPAKNYVKRTGSEKNKNLRPNYPWPWNLGQGSLKIIGNGTIG